jgi:hypothetical protein
MIHDRHNFPAVVASAAPGGHNFPEVVTIMGVGRELAENLGLDVRQAGRSR